jgi:hypothetical protein
MVQRLQNLHFIERFAEVDGRHALHAHALYGANDAVTQPSRAVSGAIGALAKQCFNDKLLRD